MDDELYDMNYDANVLARLAECKDRCWRYNQLMPSDEESRKEAIIGILGHVEGRVNIQPFFWCDFGVNISIGKNFFANHGLTILDGAAVAFGDNVFVGPDCGFYTAGHPLDPERRNRGLEYARPIKVGNDVWIGGHVTVLPGVTIGDGSTIGAGSVVTHDIPAGVVAVGNPCRVIRKLGNEEEVS